MMKLNFLDVPGRVLLSSVAFSVSALAAPPDYNFVEITYGKLKVPRYEATYRPAGFSLRGSKEFGANWFVNG